MTIIALSPEIIIDDSEISFSFIHASGPGGQNVNKVATAVQLVFDYKRSSALSQEEKERFALICKNRINSDGMFYISAQNYRTREQNRAEALNRLTDWIEKAKEKDKIRIPTKAGKIGGNSTSARREEPKRIRHYNPDDWE